MFHNLKNSSSLVSFAKFFSPEIEFKGGDHNSPPPHISKFRIFTMNSHSLFHILEICCYMTPERQNSRARKDGFCESVAWQKRFRGNKHTCNSIRTARSDVFCAVLVRSSSILLLCSSMQLVSCVVIICSYES
jgi:hypothetical protein